MQAVGGLDGIEFRVYRRGTEQHLVQIRVVEGDEDAVFVLVKRVVRSTRVLETIAGKGLGVTAHASHLEIARDHPHFGLDRSRTRAT